MNAPVLTIRQNVSPFAAISTLQFVQSKDSQITLPVLRGEKSDALSFRIYNNFALASLIADAQNVRITVYDAVGVHTANNPPAAQQWMVIVQTGYGQDSTTPGKQSDFRYGQQKAIGGSSVYPLEVSSAGEFGVGKIYAGAGGSGCGYVELSAYLHIPSNASAGTNTFALSVLYDWNT